jgi:phosphoribosylformylglycinamidine cyclo-ligase
VLEFIAATAGLDALEAYGTLNMGVGMALFVAEGAAGGAVEAAANAGYAASVAGRVEEGARQVVLEPIGVTYGSEELELA